MDITKIGYYEEENISLQMRMWKILFGVRKFMNRFYISNPLFPFLTVLIITIPIILFLSKGLYGDGKETGWFYENIMIEAHGMLFDILIFGILITLINIRRDKRLKISRFKEEINDYRGWKEIQASYRLAGIIKRLSDKGEKDLLLFDCYLVEAKLAYAYLEGAVFTYVHLERAHLEGAHLGGADFREAHLDGAYLNRANLDRAFLEEASLRGTYLEQANLKNTRLNGAHLEGAFLQGANLEGAVIEDAYLNGVRIDLHQFIQAKSLKNTIMPDGSIYSESWARRIEEAGLSGSNEEPQSPNL